MKKILPVLAALIITVVIKANAQVYGNYQYNQNQPLAQGHDRAAISNTMIAGNNEVTLKVNGLMNIVADNYIAVFNLVQVGETAESADFLMTSRISAFRQRLRSIGIDSAAATVDMLSFVPRYEVQTEKKLFSKTYNEVPAGFELQKNVLVRYKHSGKLDDIVTAAATSEIYDLVKVDYFIANTQKSLDSLRMACLQAMKAKLKSFETIGFKLDTQGKVMAEAYQTVYPPTRYVAYQAFSRPSLSAATRKSSSYQEAAKAISAFYDPVSYDQYDLVINPIITEPVVQMSYTITVRYFIPQDDKKAGYYIVTPSGDLRQINFK